MADELEGNCMVAQSGGPTAVFNASVAGVVAEALNNPCIEEILGGLNGVFGILKEDIIDLAEEGTISKDQIVQLSRNAFDIAWLSDDRKRHYLDQLDSFADSLV